MQTSEQGGALRRARIVLGIALILLGGFLLLADRPWEIPGGPVFFAVGRRLQATVSIALWWAAAANFVVCALLLATARAWTAAPEDGDAPWRPRRAGRGFVWLVLAAVLLAAGLRWNLAHGGLWADEAWSVRDTIAGIRRPSRHHPSELTTHLVSWRETLFSFERPTNHVLYSVAGHASIGAWRALAGRDPPAFDEFALRLPAYLAGLLSVAGIALLLRDWGLPRAGVAAAFYLAIHPWHITFGAEGRGYSFVIAFAILAALFLTRALATGAWRHWLLYALPVFLLLWTHLFTLYLVAALGAAGLAGIAAGRGSLRARALRAARLGVAHLAAALLLLQLMAPNLAQTREWQGDFVSRASTQLSLPAIGHLWAFLAAGVDARPFADSPEVPPGYPSLAAWAEQHVWVYPVVVGVFPILVAAGLLRLLARGGPPRWVALGLAASAPLAIAANLAAGGQWAPRFVAFGLVATVAFCAIGLEGLLARLPWPGARARRLGVALGLAAALAAFQAFVAPETRILLTRPFTPVRDAMAWLDERLGPDPRAATRAVLNLKGGSQAFQLYHPWIREFSEADELVALCAESRASGVPLYVLYSFPHKNRNERPGSFRYLDDPSVFEPVALFEGVIGERLVRVLRYTGQPVGGVG